MEPFKNEISPELLGLLAELLGKHLPSLNADSFVAPLLQRLPHLELKERVSLLAEAIHKVLPQPMEKRYPILASMLHPDVENSAGHSSTREGMCGWGVWPLTEIIGKHGLNDFDASLALLKEMTKRGTSEFDVRPFIDDDPSRALKTILSWVHDDNHHVRRLASEGTRPRLPWGMRLKGLIADPSATLPILYALRDDPSEYVRRSVANHLNDIAKDHPDLVAELALQWLRDASEPRRKLVRHACRSLIKQGHPGALAAFGFHGPEIVEPHITITKPQIVLGGSIDFSVEIRSTASQPQKLLIDYVVHFKKANGLHMPKVFKWTTISLDVGERRSLTRRHAIKPVTTRRYYDGKQQLMLRINGQDFGMNTFQLSME
ncbi:DNA alkylation repair protein [Pararhizobium sp. IMCC21322]|uniref:DNA alkylation repair protein n=1 Tax=Pararhizobium sp. IMCC21322 TaxID=3067903 RepID=UPI0027426416|nr:DNA alkylation repair protein [Pararhizobium sp. IMCC21322]